MAVRALLFTKNQEVKAVLAGVCRTAGIHLDACDDIFAAIEKGTRQTFECVLADWSLQPETSFLVKRARESQQNKKIIAIAIVERDPTPAEKRDQRLDFLIYRPVKAEEATAVFSTAFPDLESANPEDATAIDHPQAEPAETEQVFRAFKSAPAAAGADPSEFKTEPKPDPSFSFDWNDEDGPNDADGDSDTEAGLPPNRHRFTLQHACALAFVLAALILGATRYSFLKSALQAPGGIFQPSASASSQSESRQQPAAPLASAQNQLADPGPDSSSSDSSSGQSPHLEVVESQPDINGSRLELRKATDFPMTSPVAPPVVKPGDVPKAKIPDSLRNSSPITPPVSPPSILSEAMPASSAPLSAPPSSSGPAEPVPVNEQTARALLLRSSNPVYPAEAAAQQLQGTVVLQATIGRDGSVEELKIVRGYFILAKAAAAAIRQWQFKPYMLNDRPVRIQTNLTVSFDSPQN